MFMTSCPMMLATNSNSTWRVARTARRKWNRPGNFAVNSRNFRYRILTPAFSQLRGCGYRKRWNPHNKRSEEHTSELQSRRDLVCRLLLEKKKERESILKDIVGKKSDAAMKAKQK